MKNMTVANLIAIGLIAIAMVSFGGSQAYAQGYIDQAKKHILANQYEMAIKVLKDNRPIAQNKKAVAAVDNLIGWSYFSLGKMSDAEMYLNSALASAEQENNPEIRRLASNNLGVLYFVIGDLDKSLSFFNRPDTKGTRIATQYRSLIEEKRVEVEAERNLQAGMAHRGNLEFAEAVKSYDKSLSLVSNDARVLEYKGYALFRLGKHEDAINTLEAALKADSAKSLPLLPLNLIKAYCAAGQDDKIDSLIRAANVSASKLESWWQRDREFQLVCAKSVAVRNALGIAS